MVCLKVWDVYVVVWSSSTSAARYQKICLNVWPASVASPRPMYMCRRATLPPRSCRCVSQQQAGVGINTPRWCTAADVSRVSVVSLISLPALVLVFFAGRNLLATSGPAAALRTKLGRLAGPEVDPRNSTSKCTGQVARN